MAIYRNVQLSFWTDNKVLDDFTPEDKFFYIYLLTNPQTNICGCYEFSYSEISKQIGYNKDTILRLLERFEKEHEVIRFNKNNKEILILKWYKHNWSRSEKTLVGVENVARHIKTPEFKEYVLNLVESIRNQSVVAENSAFVSIVEDNNKSEKEDELKKNFEIIYGKYPKKIGKTNGFSKYKLWVTSGRMVNGKRIKLTNKQIWDAIVKYEFEMKQSETELQYYKNFDTFMGNSILDYIDMAG